MRFPSYAIFYQPAKGRPWIYHDSFFMLKDALRVAVNMRDSESYYNVYVCRLCEVPLQGYLS